jgi:Arc/MetJ-type ribon-helix-helix transcriptional regulator
VEGMMGFAATWLGKGDFQNASLWVRNALRTDWDRANRMPWAEALGEAIVFEKLVQSLASSTRRIHEDRLEGKIPEPFEREIWFLHGYCLFRSGKPVKAAEQFKQIILEVASADAEAVNLYKQIKK